MRGADSSNKEIELELVANDQLQIAQDVPLTRELKSNLCMYLFIFFLFFFFLFIFFFTRYLVSGCPEGTVNERTLLAWHRGFFTCLLLGLGTIKLLEPRIIVFVCGIYFILLVCIIFLSLLLCSHSTNTYLQHV